MFFENFHKKDKYIHIIQIIEKDFHKIKNDEKLKTELETLRMTLFEL